MNRAQAETKRRKLQILLAVQGILPKLVPALRYAGSLPHAKEQMKPFLIPELGFEPNDKEWEYLFSLSLRDVAHFPDSTVLTQIEECLKIIHAPRKKK